MNANELIKALQNLGKTDRTLPIVAMDKDLHIYIGITNISVEKEEERHVILLSPTFYEINPQQ